MLRLLARHRSTRLSDVAHGTVYNCVTTMLFPSTYSPRFLGGTRQQPAKASTITLLPAPCQQRQWLATSKTPQPRTRATKAPVASEMPEPPSNGPYAPRGKAQSADKILAAMIRTNNLPVPMVAGRPKDGQHSGLICPVCKGGSRSEPSFAAKARRGVVDLSTAVSQLCVHPLQVDLEQGTITWLCHRATCGSTGSLRVPNSIKTYA